MKKFLKVSFAALLGAAMVLVGCKQPAPMETVLEASVKTAEFSANSPAKVTVKLTANNAWTASSSAEWLSLSATSGEGDASIVLSATENIGPAGEAAPERTAQVTIKSEEKSVSVSVKQSAETVVFVTDKTSATVPAEGASVVVAVEYNTPYTVEIPADAPWITKAATKAVAQANVTLSVAANTETVSREATVTLKAASGSKTLKISQDAAVPTKVTEIASADDFASFVANHAEYEASETVKLTADVTLPADRVILDTLKCNFDGQGHKVTYAYTLAADATALHLGLFANVDKNVEVKNVKVKATFDAAEGMAYKSAIVGGIAGVVCEGAKIANCESDLTFAALVNTGAVMVGGIAGSSNDGVTIENCKSTGSWSDTAESTTADNVGGILGHSYYAITIANCTSDMNMTYLGTSTPRFGGMIGYTHNMSKIHISGCSYSGKMVHHPSKVKKQYSYIGGIVGYNNVSDANTTPEYVIENCTFSGSIDGACENAAAEYQFRAGGIIPQMPKEDASANPPTGKSCLTIRNCSNTGTITNTVTGTSAKTNTIQLGGIQAFGEATHVATIENCTFSGSIVSTGYKSTVGGIVGLLSHVDTKVTGCVVTKDAVLAAETTGSTVGAVVANPGAYTTKVTADLDACSVAKNAPAVVLTADNYTEYAFGNANITDLSGITFKGAGSGSDTPEVPANAVVVSSKEDLLAVYTNAELLAKDTLIVFTSDIDCGGFELPANGPAVAATIDGMGHSLKGIVNNKFSLFGTLTGTIMNLVIDASNAITINGDANSAFLVATNQGVIDNITVNADVVCTVTTASTTRHTGCICAINRNIVKNCVNNGNATLSATTATGQFRYAPIVGSNAEATGLVPSVINCVNNGNITFEQTAGTNGGDKYFAGIVAVQDSNEASCITDCVNYGNIIFLSSDQANPKTYPGGIVGLLKGGTITGCKNFGAIKNDSNTATSCAGGLVSTIKGGTKTQSKNTVVSLAGCVVNCVIDVPADNTCGGLVLGGMTTATDTITLGTAEAPIKVAGTVAGIDATADNFKTLLAGSSVKHLLIDETATTHVINAVFETVSK